METIDVRCERCGLMFTIAIGYPARAPHGPLHCTGRLRPIEPPQSTPRPTEVETTT